MDPIQLKEIKTRDDKLEKIDVQDLLTMLEIMSNITFFGGIKKANCEYAQNGQCSLFHLQTEAKNKIPQATECRIPNCALTDDHYHLETSNVTCTFCHQWNDNQSISKLNKRNFPRWRNK